MDLLVLDLDGTFLNANIEVTPYSRAIMNTLAEQKEVAFTFATARNKSSALRRINGIKLEYPIILNNGAAVWCTKRNQFVSIVAISDDIVVRLYQILKKHGISAFFFGISEDGEQTFFSDSDFSHSNYVEYLEDGILPRKSLTLPRVHIVNINAFFDRELDIETIETLNKLESLTIHHEIALYNDGYRLLDIRSCHAEKGTQVNLLRNTWNFRKTVCFGDGRNDLSLRDVADEFYAPANANKIIRDLATEVVRANSEDGVATKIKELYLPGRK